MKQRRTAVETSWLRYNRQVDSRATGRRAFQKKVACFLHIGNTMELNAEKDRSKKKEEGREEEMLVSPGFSWEAWVTVLSAPQVDPARTLSLSAAAAFDPITHPPWKTRILQQFFRPSADANLFFHNAKVRYAVRVFNRGRQHCDKGGEKCRICLNLCKTMYCIDSQEMGTYILVCACDADLNSSWHICAWVYGAGEMSLMVQRLLTSRRTA